MSGTSLAILFALGILIVFPFACQFGSWTASGDRMRQLTQDLREGKPRGFAVIAAAAAIAIIIQVLNGR